MEIQEETQKIKDKIYKLYGTDSGILFGINSPTIVSKIIEITLELSRKNPLLIESHTEDGVEWGVSFNSSNPESQDYVACKTADDAVKLIAILNNKPNDTH